MLTFLLVMLFILGLVVGSFLNVCIYRIPLEKSILWPGSHCGRCFQPIRWYDNLPLISYVVLRGRCRTCGARFSARYFLIELLTGLSFAGLFYLEIVRNVHHFAELQGQAARMQALRFPEWQAWVVFGFHALLICFLIVASFCDLDHTEIPLGITVPGTVLGLVGATLWPWPWPLPLAPVLNEGLYPWPFWFPLPGGFAPGGNWQTGLATGVAGVLVGTLMLRAIRFLFGMGLGVEALGLGDADLMMMAGSFIGWQPVVVAFFIGVFVGLIFGVFQLIIRGDNLLPFGPALAVGIVATMLGWHWIGPHFQLLFFDGRIMFALAAISGVLMLAVSYLLRVTRLLRRS
jgi:leader peptidase (prepilin peptidase)/N-methyltransferase